jgi:hypothetical protein
MTGARTKTMAKPPSRLDAPGVPSLLYLPEVGFQLRVTAAAHICVAKSLQTRQTQFGRLGASLTGSQHQRRSGRRLWSLYKHRKTADPPQNGLFIARADCQSVRDDQESPRELTAAF